MANYIRKTITKNGIYNASDDGVDGYSVVEVSVPPTYSKAVETFTDPDQLIDFSVISSSGEEVV